MRQADWIVVPSIWWENAPLVILEARAAGRPVICSGIGGMAELVDGRRRRAARAARATPPRSPKPCAAAAEPGALGAARRRAAPAGHAAFVDAHLALYQRLLDRVPA